MPEFLPKISDTFEWCSYRTPLHWQHQLYAAFFLHLKHQWLLHLAEAPPQLHCQIEQVVSDGFFSRDVFFEAFACVTVIRVLRMYGKFWSVLFQPSSCC